MACEFVAKSKPYYFEEEQDKKEKDQEVPFTL